MFSFTTSIYVGYPNIAQNAINKGSLGVVSESITNPTPDAIDLDLQSVVLTHSKYHPQLDAFDASFHLEGSDTPFIQFRAPAVKAVNGTPTHVHQRVQIQNLDAYTEYTIATLLNEELTVHLRGKGGLKQGGLPRTTVTYNQKITTKGKSLLLKLPETTDPLSRFQWSQRNEHHVTPPSHEVSSRRR